MKLFLAIVAASCTTTLAFSPSSAGRIHGVRSMTKLYAKKVGIYYSTQTGNTETIAGYISEAAGIDGVNDIGDVTNKEILGLDSIIVGAPTWHTGEDSERSGTSWDSWLYDTLPNLDLKGKNVAVFGVGDQQSYDEVRYSVLKAVVTIYIFYAKIFNTHSHSLTNIVHTSVISTTAMPLESYTMSLKRQVAR